MTNEQIANISAYTQFDRDKYEQQGLGLGLSIVCLLAKLNDAELIINSKPKQGTTASVVFRQNS